MREGQTIEIRDAKVRGSTEAVKEFPHAAQPSPIVHANARPTIELMGGVTRSRLTVGAEEEAEFLEINYAPGRCPARACHTMKGVNSVLFLKVNW
jgi:hypothetical protein